MPRLIDALRSAAHTPALAEIPVPTNSPLALFTAASAGADAGAHDIFTVSVQPPPFGGTFTATLDAGDARTATLNVDLNGSLTWTSAPNVVTLTGPIGATLTVKVDATGVSAQIRGGGPVPLAIAGSPLKATAGPMTVEADLRSAELDVGAGGPSITVQGTIRISGAPALPTVTVPAIWRWDRSGLTAAAGAPVGGADVSLMWSGATDVLPASIEVSARLGALANPVAAIHADTGPSRVRLRASRAAGSYDVRLEIEAGDDGIMHSSDPVTAAFAVLATATVADTAGSPGLEGAAEIAALVTTAQGLVDLLTNPAGSATVNAARFDLANPNELEVDYIADLSCEFDAGIVGAKTQAPMRVAVNGSRLGLADPSKPVFSLASATLDLVDPGQWAVTKPAGLLQVMGTRSGHGSSWFELDLRFALDLGPVTVDDAVVRIFLGAPPSAQLRGLGVSVDLPGLITGSGQVAFPDTGGFAASLSLRVIPLGLSAAGSLEYFVSNGISSLLATLAIGLPVPVPIGTSGLGLFGVAGLVGLHRSPTGGGLGWNPVKDQTKADPASNMFGAALAVGTLPDLGFSLSAIGRVVVSTPQLAVRAAIDASILSSPRDVTAAVDPTPIVGIKGLLVVDPSTELYAGVTGTVDIPPGASFELLRVTIPVEARYPVTSPENWFVHIGTDGKRGGSSPGPVTVDVLPDLFGTTAQGFLMVHGNGFSPGIAGLSPTPTGGLAVAVGFAFSTSYGFPPVWAELHVGAVAVVGTKPAYVAGSASAGGSLHLGPFSLGLDAGIDFQAGPGSTRYANLHACGSIDLWLTSITGCIDISFGSKTQPNLDPPGDPLAGAAIADVDGMTPNPNRQANPGALSTNSGGAPAMWPDGCVLFGFSPAPKLTGSAGGFNDDLKGGGAGTTAATDGTLGKAAGYDALWELTALSLHDETAGSEVTASLPARWQLPPVGPSPQGPGARVLALMTSNQGVWTLPMASSPARLPGDPAKVGAVNCQQAWAPSPGWVAGGWATPSDAVNWTLPPLESPLSPLATAITATVATTGATVGGRQFTLGPGAAAALPTSASVIPAGPTVQDPIAAGPGLPGWLPLSDVVVGPKVETGPVLTTVTFSDTLLDGPTSGFDPTMVLVTVKDLEAIQITSSSGGTDQPWTPIAQQPGPGGLNVGVFAWKQAGAITVATIHHPRLEGTGGPVAFQIGIAGAAGISHTAWTAAASANASGSSADAANHAGLPKTAAPILQEGHVYRVHHEWSASTPPGGATTSGGPQDHYFRVATHAAEPPAPEVRYQVIDTFHPLMLGRYVKAYHPDGTSPWFIGDAVSATLSGASITDVAAAYGYDMKLAVTRTDPPPGVASGGQPMLQLLGSRFALTTHLELLDAIDSYARSVTGGECLWPYGAVDAIADATLVANATYDIAVAFDPKAKDPLGNPKLPNRAYCTLPPVVFRTSRWASPSELFAAFGFGAAAPNPLHLVAASAVTLPAESCDGALMAALTGAGVVPPLLDADARISVIWRADAAGPWSVNAVLLESVEPLVRGERLKDLTMEGFTATTDSSAATVLFVATAPGVVGPLTLKWGGTTPGQADLVLPQPSVIPGLSQEIRP